MVHTKDRHTGREKIILYAGEHYITDEEDLIETTVGGCICFLLNDRVSGTCGMVHFMLTQASSVDIYEKKSLLYGVNAVQYLISEFKSRGACSQCEASLVGGSSYTGKDSGLKLCSLARILIESEDIPIVREDLGGKLVRKVLLDGANGKIYVRKRLMSSADQEEVLMIDCCDK